VDQHRPQRRAADVFLNALPAWTPYTETARAEMMLDYQCRVEHDARRAPRLAWSSLR